jgi:uncharacterized protein YyaL (SSP411 family)
MKSCYILPLICETPMPAPANRLIHETSPYLLQHAGNPVEWFPWCDEAFDLARRDGKPVLLSIGYSACHWCHVMAHESFENEEIAQVMNDSFVNIKVDREERPDLDLIYQNAVQFFIRRGGGWPLTVFLTPDRVPFYGGTYFPPNDRFGLPCFPKLLSMLAESYRNRPDDIAKTTADVRRALSTLSQPPKTLSKIAPDILERAVSVLSRAFDTTHGGFGGAPKFPSTPALGLMLRFARKTEETDLRSKVTYTLGKMAWGGIYDQLGGGFHRYSTDAHWLVPHFEKMLYDNAQLAPLYFNTYRASGQPFYRQIGEEILQDTLREMTAPEGGFYSTQDADTGGHEGATYVWTPAEICDLLGEEAGRLVCQHYGVTADGNFEGKNILHVSQPIETLAKACGKSSEEIATHLAAARKTLLAQRRTRPQPFRDEKVITSWNGLMIVAFVEGYNVTRNRHYLETAQRAAAFVTAHLCKNGRLLRTWKDGVARLNAYLDDYAFFIEALCALYEATGDGVYLAQAGSLARGMIERYADETHGGFFLTSSDHETLLVRDKPVYDQSIPSGNAGAASALLRLFYLTGEADYFNVAERALQFAAGAIGDHYFGCGNLVAATDFYWEGAIEIVLIASPDLHEALLSKIQQCDLPNKVIHWVRPDRQGTDNLPAPVRGKSAIDGKPTVYLCRRGTCSQPMTEWDDIQKALQCL